MKKTYIFWMVALMVLALPTACVDDLIPDSVIDEFVEPAAPSIDSITIRATIEQGVTKTALNGSYEVVWNYGDQIKVFNASNPDGKVYTLKDECDGELVGLFEGEALSGDGPFYAVYPASAAGTLQGGQVSVNVPALQDYEYGSFDVKANITTAMASSLDEFYFKNVCGILAVTLKGDSSISELLIISDTGEPLGGDALITPSMSDAPAFAWNPNGTQSSQAQIVSASCAQLTDEGTTFYVVLPAGALSGGFSIEIHDGDGNAMVRHGSGSTIVRSSIRPMPALDYAAEVNGSFLYDTYIGAYDGAAPGEGYSSCCLYFEGICQYAYSVVPGAEGRRYTRIQSMINGYALAVTTPYDIHPGGVYAASIDAMGETGGIVSNANAQLKVLKIADGLIWMTDGSHGFILMMEEE
ncbi:MAG: hypothetical protein K6F25_04685 [Bacteroidales bacterium]|nr:hypothetical protein [Bacteroidales bacterium]